MAKRKCKICGKALSAYNKKSICFCHQPGQRIYKYIPVTSFTGYENTPSGNPNEMTLFKPGSERYSDKAFDRVCIGYVGDDGEIIYLEDLEDE